jgi:SAM-dependent methyltransferase
VADSYGRRDEGMHSTVTDDISTLLDAWEREERAPFGGWDFAHLQGRMVDEEAPWSYPLLAAERLAGATSVLDLGTGGGERLGELRPHWLARVVATEDYPPNVSLAHHRLSPLGAAVVHGRVDEKHALPFADGAFDLVLNRHSALNIDEVARVLASGGVLLTQQVHGRYAEALLAVFGARPQWPEATPDKYLPWIRRAGLTVDVVHSWQGRLTFADVGAIVYYLKAVPWRAPGFAVRTQLKPLLALQRRLRPGEVLSFAARLYLIEAHK